jgi:hypothetical protein
MSLWSSFLRIGRALLALLTLGRTSSKKARGDEVIVDAPVFVSPEELVAQDTFQQLDPDIRLGDLTRQDPQGGPATPPALPPGGIVAVKGVVSQFTGCGDGCSCQTVTLVRVETRDLLGTVGSFIFGTRRSRFRITTVFDRNDPTRPPQSGPLRFPARNPGDLVCFYFSYPPCFAYLGTRGREHPCLAKVEVSFPSFNPGQQNFVNTYQLFSVRGLADFATATRNVVCVQPNPNRTIPAGTGSVAWSVRDVVCQRVNFTVF